MLSTTSGNGTRRIARWFRAVTLGAACAVWLVPSAFSQPARLLPVDEAASDPSFFAFRMELAEAIARRDTAFVVGVLAPDVKIGFGGEVGPAEFGREWFTDDDGSRLWTTLGRLVAGGGRLWEDRQNGNLFEAPYWSAFWDAEAYDPFEHAVVLRDRVAVLGEPSPGVDMVAELTFDIVRVIDPFLASSSGDGDVWVQVELGSGQSGFVRGRHLASPLDYRIAFRKVADGWKIQWLLAGD